MKMKIGFILAVALIVTGCANISTLNRTTILPPRGDGPVTGTGPQSNQVDYSTTKASGLAIHLDAPQRLVLSKNGIVCAEPSPDALQAVAASQGLSFMAPSQATINLANALSTNAGSIGLRTQSITLMREIFYRVCEAAYSGLLPEFEVTQMIRRSQDLTLGVLAIEQLTGTVKAQQIAISTNATADASGNLAATQASLVAARNNELSLKTAAKEAGDKVTEQETKIAALNAKLTPSTPATEAQKTELKREGDKLQTLKDESEFANSSYSDAQRVTKKIQENLGRAMLAASATAGGKASFSNDSYDGISSATSEKISDGVYKIVKEVVTKDYIVEQCISYLLQGTERALTQDFASSGSETVLPKQLLDLATKLDMARAKVGPEGSFEIDELNRQRKSIEETIDATDAFNKQKRRGILAVNELCTVALSRSVAAKQAEIARAAAAAAQQETQRQPSAENPTTP